MAGKQSAAMDRAKKAIEAGKMNKEQAAAKYGLSAISISRKDWYRAYMQKEQAHG